MHASASQVAAPPRLRAPAWLAPLGLAVACVAAAISLSSPRLAEPADVGLVAEPTGVVAAQPARAEVERIEVRNDELVLDGAAPFVARRVPLSIAQEGLSAALLVELAAEPGYEAWRAAFGRELDSHLTIERFAGSGRTFVRATLSGADLPAVEKLFESVDGQLSPMS